MSGKVILIAQSLSRLMSENEYDKITMSAIAENANVGRATLYRYFNSKEEILLFCIENCLGKFISTPICPSSKDEYSKFVTDFLTVFNQHKALFKLIRQARKEHICLDFLNKIFTDSPCNTTEYAPYIYAGMLFNISMEWLDNDCKENNYIIFNRKFQVFQASFQQFRQFSQSNDQQKK